jgi:hypothetical protein
LFVAKYSTALPQSTTDDPEVVRGTPDAINQFQCWHESYHRWIFCFAAAGIQTPNQQIMRRFEEHQQGETK